jgi:hypothetical protein
MNESCQKRVCGHTSQNQNSSILEISKQFHLSSARSLRVLSKQVGEIVPQNLLFPLERLHGPKRKDLKHNSKACPPQLSILPLQLITTTTTIVIYVVITSNSSTNSVNKVFYPFVWHFNTISFKRASFKRTPSQTHQLWNNTNQTIFYFHCTYNILKNKF